MSRFLFLFTIGPVQSFIAQARKTHDLYTGSRLMSDLVGYAIERLPQDMELIFPTPSHKDLGNTLNSTPNEFIALIHCDDPREIGEKLKREVQNKFKTIVNDDVITKQGLSKPNGLDRQIEDFPEVYWAAIQFNDGDNYHEKYKQLTRLMGAVKNTRTFKQLPEEGRKCSLCGERNALFYKPNIDENGFEKRPKYIDDNAIKINDTRMARGEALCGICFVKRYYWKDEKSFHPLP
ncbi:MAG: hypothetical protein GX075_06910, partial [Firmicutes bacterium]|nr:hypothetical protein [Bacillota bacterium]